MTASVNNDWVRNHRTGLLLATAVLLGVFVPVPGYIIAALFWPGGIHDLDSTRESIAFLVVLIGISGVVWAVIANAVLPRRR